MFCYSIVYCFRRCLHINSYIYIYICFKYVYRFFTEFIILKIVGKMLRSGPVRNHHHIHHIFVILKRCGVVIWRTDRYPYVPWDYFNWRFNIVICPFPLYKHHTFGKYNFIVSHISRERLMIAPSRTKRLIW